MSAFDPKRTFGVENYKRPSMRSTLRGSTSSKPTLPRKSVTMPVIRIEIPEGTPKEAKRKIRDGVKQAVLDKQGTCFV